MRPDDIVRLHSLSAPALAPDGRSAVVALSRPDLGTDAYRGALWSVPTGGDAEPRRLTNGPLDSGPVFSPDGQWLAFLRADAGPAQLHVMATGGGEPWQVTDHPLGVEGPQWSPDSRRIAYAARVPEEGRYGGDPAKEPPRRITGLRYRYDGVGFTNDRRFHVFTADPHRARAQGPGTPERITEGDYDHRSVAWSPDGALLAFEAARHEGRDGDHASDVWVCAPDGSGLRRVTGTGHIVETVRFAPDGRALLFTGTDVSENHAWHVARHVGLWSVPVDGSAKPRPLFPEEDHHIAPGGVPVATDDGILVPVERRGAVELLRVPYEDGEPAAVVTGPRQVQAAASARGTVVATVADAASSGELVRIDGGERALTAFAEGISPLPLEEITTAAPDGHPVHGWLVRPEGPGPHPVLLMIHGGPFRQYGWQLFDEAQVYAGAGYAVVMGNPRGSSGYGQAHGKAVTGDVGRVSAIDLLALLDAALERGGLDASRAGVLGGSHGGFMTTWLAAHHGDRFKAAITERAVNAIDSFHGTSDEGWTFAFDLYGPDPSGWTAQSPLTHAGKIAIPTLIIHAEQDYRCPLEQAQRLFVALKLRGVETEMLLFPGEGHEMSRSGLPSHRVARFEAILDWWSRHL
ncbi:S9 family peptidase [Nocardiopsis sediminis]|uniref:S9 family peptidase n=1 Tax=Nocardiopsis sediminis TaxID=1778267 RepID=A0ABV8FSA5_9ACTN